MQHNPLKCDVDSKPKIQQKYTTPDIGGYVLWVVSIATVLAALLFLVGCASINKAYVEADRATYESIAPRYLNYLENDASLRSWEKDLYKELTKSWMERIQEAEK